MHRILTSDTMFQGVPGVDEFDPPRLRSVLIGTERLLAECGEVLRQNSHELVAVVAPPGPAADWARRLGLLLLGSPLDLLSSGLGKVDYLFSISNLSALPQPVLDLASRAAINFHDGPLPDLAGLNAPVWALLNGADRHAITWHLMSDKVDCGPVIAAEGFAISPGETALSLNTKCMEQGLASFAAIAINLPAAVAAAVPQSTPPVRLMTRRDRPTAAATIDWNSDAQDIARLVVALDFGPHGNPLSLPKAMFGADLILVREVTVLPAASNEEPGTIVVSGPSPVVATATNDLRLDRIETLGNRPLPAFEITDRFASLDEERSAELSAINAAAGVYETWWLDRLKMRDAVHLPAFRARPDGAAQQWKTSDRAIPQGWSRTDALTFVIGWLARVADRDTVEIGYSDDVGLSRIERVADWFVAELPMKVDIDFSQPLANLTRQIDDEVAGLHKRVAVSRDLLARFPQPREQACFEHPIAVQIVASLDAVRPSAEGVLNLAICLASGTYRWSWDEACVDQLAVEDLWRGFDAMQASFQADPETPLGALSLLTSSEEERVIREWNAAMAPGHEVPGYHHLFASQASLHPSRTAVTSLGQSLSYAELDAAANRMARYLAAQGVEPGTLVGLHVPRSVEMLVCLLAVHKAGGAYVPLDPAYPGDRLAHMIVDSKLALILSETQAALTLPDTGAPVLCVDALGEALAELSSDPFDGGATSENLAYVIYTSGSTGLPKGVMIEHRNLLNFMTGMDRYIEPDGTWLAVTSLSFDISILELLYPLTRGQHVVIATEREVRGEVEAAVTTRTATFSLFYFASSNCGSAAEQYRLLLEGARFADANGFEAVWTPERHFHDFGGPYPNPSVASAAIAASTSRIQIRAGSVVGTLHHPVRIAEEWALVDNISNGRVGIAFASGWQPNDFILNPEAFKDRAGTLKRTMDDVRGLWRGEARSYPGALGKDVEVRSFPRPVQAELPCWITSAGNVDTFIEAGRVGANVLTHLLGQTIAEVAEKLVAYREAWREAGHPGEGRATLMLHTFLGEDREQVRRIVREPLIEYLRTATSLLKQFAWSFPAFKRPPGTSEHDGLSLSDLSAEETDALMEHAFDRYFEANGLFGTVKENAEFIRELEAAGVDEIGCLVDFGIAPDTVLEHLPAIARLKTIVDRSASLPESPLHELMTRHRVTHLQCTPSLLAVLASDKSAPPGLARLQRLMVGGEPFPPALAGDMLELVGGTVMNMYGPTETTIWSAVCELTHEDATPPPLGRPLANQQVYIVDRRMQAVRPGAPGELLIGGEGVARGYLGRPELTDERFAAHPFLPGLRAYRTGDLARQRADGTLEFLGRLDHQVKIRGYRIELGEIEARIVQLGGMAEAVGVARREGDATSLVAYVVPGPSALSVDALRKSLRQHLPEFMVPGTFVILDAVPRTPNGKIDRKALPDPVKTVVVGSVSQQAAPASEIEARIRSVWCDLLKTQNIGLHDNFFDIGGHSLLAIQAHRALSEIAPKPLALTDIFRFPTIAALGAYLGDHHQSLGAQAGIDRALARRNSLQRRSARTALRA